MSKPETEQSETGSSSAPANDSVNVSAKVSAAVSAEVSGQQPDEEPNRLAEPVDHEQPPRLPFAVVGIGASAGGIEAFGEFFKVMPSDSGLAFVLVQHLPPNRESMVAEILARHTKMPVQQVKHGMPVEPNHVYVIRPGHTMTIKDGKLHLGERVDKPRHSRPVDDFFRSLAEEQRERAICIVMSGMGSNGSAGAQAVKAVGGFCIAQDPESAQFPSMPHHLIDAGCADYVLRPQEMPDVLMGYARHPYASDRAESERLVRREKQQVREVLAILRTRARHDFTGYKKPTVLRRIQRRMGLNRVTSLSEYTKLLRQSPTEITSLGDDLLIHVTGFFRDADAWEAMRQQVIVPLVANRELDAPVRAWVTACSSGEEAYTLAILLVEECERINKPLDIKIFATDTATRTLANARNGVYPGGIEAEMSPERLDRFFQREDSIYRVRQDLRERLVFAPQNVLQDPPFSRLDIVTCRNLMIYLEPEVQHRVMSLLHFGLREGGVLFLGNSETIAGVEELYEPIDKRARIFRRVGPTRHGLIELPTPRADPETSDTSRNLELRGPGVRLSIAQLTRAALLAKHVPAAVTIDREMRIVYFHGNTSAYLAQPTGEPTRDVLQMAHDEVRGAIRSALNRAMTKGTTETALDGWVDTDAGKRRLVVTASPLDAKAAPEYFVVSFETREELLSPSKAESGNGDDRSETEELHRIRDELRNAVEELQTSNEEHKASAEEVMSINEELQSSNEELETSKEEMQSLNEELTTVNAQLQAKIEEQQATANDLASLLSSTDIAVLFLDTQLRIRRFTPPAKNLFDVIDTDLGRPLGHFTKKFTDARLLDDAQLVLDRLAPLSAEVRGENGRGYVRRILPYRTADNHIEGVVITFVDVSELKQAETARIESEHRLADELNAMRTLHEVTNRVLLSPDLNSALDEIFGAAMELHMATMGSIQLYDSATQTLEVASSRGFDERFPFTMANIKISDGIACARALREGNRVIVEDVMTDPGYAPHRRGAEELGYRAVQCTPLLTRKGDILGILATYFREPHRPSENQLRVTDLLARLASDVIERLRSESEITRLKRTEESAKEVVNEGARLKDEFLATLSHELRTPLSAILLWAKTLRDTPKSADYMKEGLDSIVSSAQSQARLIDDLLDSSRIIAGKMRLELDEIDLTAVVRAAVEAIEPASDAKRVQITTEFSDDIGSVVADRERIHQILWNLLTNAMKFTPSGGQITVSARRIEGDVELRVADTGSGIDPQFLPHVFDRFRQFEGSLTRTYGGLGLGLTITKQLVELHGGTITALSEGPGKGAQFIVRLPLPPMRRRRSSKRGTSTEQAPESLTGVSILFVEDDRETRNVVTSILKRAGADVTSVDSAAAAVEQFKISRPTLVLSDIGLPEVDGYSLLQNIRMIEARQKAEPVPAIALTAYARPEDRQKTIDAGYVVHLGKPVDPAKLLSTISAVVG